MTDNTTATIEIDSSCPACEELITHRAVQHLRVTCDECGTQSRVHYDGTEWLLRRVRGSTGKASKR